MADELDAVWKALSDPTRRAILDLLRKGPRTTTEIVDSFTDLTRFGVMKHIDVLRQAGLINTREEGRQRVNSLNAVPIRRIYERWVRPFEGFWADTLLRIKEDVERKRNKEIKVNRHTIVTRKEWLDARKEHLKAEKEFTRMRDLLAAQRRSLPWVKVEQDYVFEGAEGPATLAELFDGRNQLMVYHFMFAPDWTQGCKSCSLLADHYDPAIIHLNHRDVSMVTVSRAPIDKLMAFRERMGWKFRWVSSGGNRFNQDYGIYFTAAERESGLAIYNYEKTAPPISDLPGLSVFARDEEGTIYHTYSTYARGLDIFLNVYNLLDVTPKGRDEEGMPNMSWVRHHDRYGIPGFVDPWIEAAARAKAGA